MKIQNPKIKDQNKSKDQNLKKFWILKLVLGICFGFCIFIFGFPEAAFAAVTGQELVENAKLYDGQTIDFQGEVIGDIMIRGDHAWLNVNDGTRAIGIWSDKSLVQKIKTIGDYNHVGDLIKITGEFHRACTDHGGDLDIHAQEISIITEGYKVDHPIDPWKLSLAVILLIATLAVYLFFVWKKKIRP